MGSPPPASPVRESPYRPPVPSPLNPSSSETPSRRHRRGSYNYSHKRDHSHSHNQTLAARKASRPMSPTQQLMRQKAAAAWKLAARQDAATPSHNANGTSMSDKFTSAIGEYDDVDLGVWEADMEKQPFVDFENFQMDWAMPMPVSSETGITAQSDWLSRVITTRRVLVAGSFLFFVGIWSILRCIGEYQTR